MAHCGFALALTFGCGKGADATSSSAAARIVTSLNESGWTFVRQDFPSQEPIAAAFDDSAWLSVTIPHDWNGGIDGMHADVFEGPDMYLGPAWYRARISVDPEPGKRHRLKFEGVASLADVWLNGTHLGQHRGGYTAFDFDVTDALRADGENVLVVRASNENDPEIAPWMAEPFGRFPSSSDYAPYGGIHRDVSLVSTGAVAIESHFHETPSVTAELGQLTFRTTVVNAAAETADVTLLTEVLDAERNVVLSTESTAAVNASGRRVFEGAASVEAPRLWSPEAPHLYTVRSTVMSGGAAADSAEEPLGFRWYTLENGTGFVMNGEPSFLRGVNRHQDMEGVGYALSNAQHRRDVELIKNLGFNYIRHAHYPADEAFVQACDELGVMLWLEIPVSTAVSAEPAFWDNAESQLTEMIEQSYNHPSIIVWGLGNESDRIGRPDVEASVAETRDLIRRLNSVAQQLDSTRPTTGCNYVNPNNQDTVDVYSPQDWSGWYSGNYTQYAPQHMIGEYGSSIHLDHHDEDFVSSGSTLPWPQEYGAEYHEYKASLGWSERDAFPGHLVWVAFDFASPRADRASNPIPFMNQKGLFLHDHQTKKDVAYFYESFNTSADVNPMVYIVSETWLDRITAPGTLTIWAYSNAETVELFNGPPDAPKQNSLGVARRDAGPRGDTRFQWDDANLTGPVLTAEARVNDEIVARHSFTFEGEW